MVPGCKQPVRSRGLCSGCYTRAMRLIRLGRTSWDKLVALGVALPPYPGEGRSKFGKFLASKLGK